MANLRLARRGAVRNEIALLCGACVKRHPGRNSGCEDRQDHGVAEKPQGGVRGIVVGDFMRRVVARTLAQQLGPAVALSTTGASASPTAMTDLDPTTTLLSVDGIGVFDLISREAMLAWTHGG